MMQPGRPIHSGPQSGPRPGCGREKGFTLTELLVSLGVLAIVALATFSIFSEGMAAWSKILGRSRMLEDTRTTFTTISRDLMCATMGSWSDVSTNNTIRFYLRNDVLTYAGGLYSIDNDSLTFATTTFHPQDFFPGTTYSRMDAGLTGMVRFEIEKLNGGSYQRRVAADLSDITTHELVRSYDCPSSFAYMNESGGTPSFRSTVPIGLSVISLNIELYRNASGGTGWLNSWAFTSLPEAARVTLGVRKNTKKYYDNVSAAAQNPANFMDYYYMIIELPNRDRPLN